MNIEFADLTLRIVDGILDIIVDTYLNDNK